LRENAGHHDKLNKDQEKKEDKEIEKTSMDIKEEEAIGETFKDQEMMASPSMHQLLKFLDRNQPTNHKSAHYEQ
jgi:hypothetical protein